MSRSAQRTETERQAAFERFTQARLERAYRLAGIVLRGSVGAQDVVHDAAVQAWLHWGDLRDPERLDAWFDRIVVNACRTYLRRPTLPTVDPDRIPEPVALGLAMPDLSARLADRDALHRALAQLDADHRIAVVLRYVFDLSPSQIAERTSVREGTVKSRLHYALRQLRAAIEADERDPGGGR